MISFPIICLILAPFAILMFFIFLIWDEENNFRVLRSIKNKIFKPKIIPFEDLPN